MRPVSHAGAYLCRFCITPCPGRGRPNLPPGAGRLSPDPWPVYRTPWPPIRGPSCAGQAPGPCYLVRAWWAAGRGPWAVARVPGGRPRAWWRAPGGRPPVPGPGPPAAGARPPYPPRGPKNAPGRWLRGLRPGFTQSVLPGTVFLFPGNRPPLQKTRFRLAIFRGTNTIRSMKTTCSKCGQPNDRLPQRYCRVCHAAYARAHRPRHADLPPDQRQRAVARAYANVYQRRGKIAPEPCSMCHDPVAQKHHDDYSRPLQVRWLCRKCHLTVHTGDKTLHVKP